MSFLKKVPLFVVPSRSLTSRVRPRPLIRLPCYRADRAPLEIVAVSEAQRRSRIFVRRNVASVVCLAPHTARISPCAGVHRSASSVLFCVCPQTPPPSSGSVGCQPHHPLWIPYGTGLASDLSAAVLPVALCPEFGECIDGEPLGSDLSAPNDSDTSAAPTQYHEAHAKASEPGKVLFSALAPIDDQHALLTSTLIPILEKVSGHQHGLEAVSESGPLPASGAPTRTNWTRSELTRVPATRVPAKRSSGGVHAVELSQISGLAASEADADGRRPPSARSDNASTLSFGSANSAFTMLSPSSSSSQLPSPRPGSKLKASQSHPALAMATHKGKQVASTLAQER